MTADPSHPHAPTLADPARRQLAALAGTLAELGVTRMELTEIARDATRAPTRGLLARQTDLPGVIGAALLAGKLVDLRIAQMDLTIRIWSDAGQVHLGCEPSDHPHAGAIHAAEKV